MSAASPAPGSRRALPAFILVTRREMLVRLRSRVFIGGTVVMVALVVGGILAFSYLQPGSTSQTQAVRVGFSGGSQGLEASFESFAVALGETVTVTDVADAATGRARIQAGTLDMAVGGTATAPSATIGQSLPSMVEIALDAATQEARLAAAGLTPAAITSVMAGVPFEPVPPGGSSSVVIDQSIFAALIVAILLFVSIQMYGIQVAQGVVEEKATRIIEILLSTIRPAELLAGKILGIGFVGLLQLAMVAAAGLITGGLSHGVSIPALGAVQVACYLAWFLLGFLLYAAALAAVAALVSRQEEIQGAAAPVSVLLAGFYVLMFFALPDPTSPWVTVVSFLPPAAPIFMSMRIAEVGVPAWQVGLAMVLTVATIIGVVRLAGRMYANAVMRIGPRVPFLEAFSGRGSG
jgi:ABC-2 type transport system permease protein